MLSLNIQSNYFKCLFLFIPFYFIVTLLLSLYYYYSFLLYFIIQDYTYKGVLWFLGTEIFLLLSEQSKLETEN